MSCVAPHRLARFARGQLTGRGHARIAVHVDDCARCRTALDRVRAAQGTFAAIAERDAPELRWDRIRAQAYWTTGSQPALPAVAPRSRRPWLLAPVAIGALAAAWFVFDARRPDASLAITPGPAPAVAVVEPSVVAAPLRGVVTLVEGRGEIVTAAGATLVGGAAVGAHLVGAGDRLIGDGRLAVQFGAGSAFTVGPNSTLEIARFDERAVELVLADGARVDVEVSHRGAEQRFAVRAGDRTVEVRGTAFRVERTAGAVAVACEHGRVAVSGVGDLVEVGAGQRLSVSDGDPLQGRAVVGLTAEELAQLVAARPAALPRWTDAETVMRTTAALPLLAPSGHAVSIDGVATGTGSLWRRVSPGRHLVESTDLHGRVAPGQWVEVGDGPEAPVVVAAAPPPPDLPATGTAAARRARMRELARAIDDLALRGCVRSLAKQGLADGTHVELEVGVSAAGDLRYLNVVDTDLPDRVTACVRDVVGRARLTAGAQVSWRHRVAF